MSSWMLYILKCHDDSYYTGITNDLEKRIAEHRNGTGAKYTRGRGPFKVIYLEPHADRSAASKREHAIKKLSRPKKEDLIRSK